MRRIGKTLAKYLTIGVIGYVTGAFIGANITGYRIVSEELDKFNNPKEEFDKILYIMDVKRLYHKKNFFEKPLYLSPYLKASRELSKMAKDRSNNTQ